MLSNSVFWYVIIQACGKKQCKFFKWVDQVDGPMTFEEKEDKFFEVLTNKIVEMRKIQRQLQICLGICIGFSIFVVGLQLVLYVTK